MATARKISTKFNVNKQQKATILLLVVSCLLQVTSFGRCEPKQSKQQQDDIETHPQSQNERRIFVEQLLKTLHEQYGSSSALPADGEPEIRERRWSTSGQLSSGSMMTQLLEAIGAEGDMRRLVDWVRNSFNPSSIPEVTTQFVVSKLGSINCPAILKPDREESLVPRFLLFNEHFVEVPYELSINPTSSECLTSGHFDPMRKTVILIHGYLTGYTLVDGVTNIKDRLLDLNKRTSEQAIETFIRSNGSYLFTDDLDTKIRSQLYNVIIVDWYKGANPTPRANYIRAAVNAQVVGKLIARFLSSLIVQCNTPASNLQIIAHSLGCHVSGFTGKALNAAGHRLAKITHLDPVGLCFGRLFSQPRYRLSPDDALETQAVHVSLNLFDNPLDGVHSNFLVNGGRDQLGCGGQSELRNSTAASVSLLFDPAARFAPCSHLRALALFEDDHSSQPANQCQFVGYRCSSYDRFLAGKCGQCDATNGQCRLMSLPKLSMRFQKLQLTPSTAPEFHYNVQGVHYANDEHIEEQPHDSMTASSINAAQSMPFNLTTTTTTPAPTQVNGTTRMFGAPSYLLDTSGGGEQPRADRRLSLESRERLTLAIGRLRADTRKAFADGWTNLKGREIVDSQQLATAQSNDQLGSTTPRPPDKSETSEPRLLQEELADAVPLGAQLAPKGSLNGPLFFLGTGGVSPYCVNYYQFRVLIAESRLARAIQNAGLASNNLAPTYQNGNANTNHFLFSSQARAAHARGRDMLHLTLKLIDSAGHFFKGFSMLEDARSLARVTAESLSPSGSRKFAGNEPMAELTMLLNTTQATPPVRIGETIISYYFHPILLADRLEVNYMSNISPEIRAKYSSVLCPVAINDRHQLVRYVECHKAAAAAATVRRK